MLLWLGGDPRVQPRLSLASSFSAVGCCWPGVCRDRSRRALAGEPRTKGQTGGKVPCQGHQGPWGWVSHCPDTKGIGVFPPSPPSHIPLRSSLVPGTQSSELPSTRPCFVSETWGLTLVPSPTPPPHQLTGSVPSSRWLGAPPPLAGFPFVQPSPRWSSQSWGGHRARTLRF